MAISTLYLQVVPLDDSTRSDPGYICILVAALSFRNYARGTSKKSRDRGRIVRKNDPPCINPYPAAITPRVTVKPCAYRVPRVLPRKKREEKKRKERSAKAVKNWWREEAVETRGIIIFEHLPRLLLPLLLLRLRFGSPSRAVDTRFSRNNITVIIFTFGPFARIPHKWHGPAINCHDRQLPDRPSVRSGINGNARACESARVRPRLFSRFPRLSLDNCF